MRAKKILALSPEHPKESPPPPPGLYRQRFLGTKVVLQIDQRCRAHYSPCSKQGRQLVTSSPGILVQPVFILVRLIL